MLCSSCPFPGLQQDQPEESVMGLRGWRQDLLQSDLDCLPVPGSHSLSSQICSSERGPRACMEISAPLKCDSEGVRPGVGLHLVRAPGASASEISDQPSRSPLVTQPSSLNLPPLFSPPKTPRQQTSRVPSSLWEEGHHRQRRLWSGVRGSVLAQGVRETC